MLTASRVLVHLQPGEEVTTAIPIVQRRNRVTERSRGPYVSCAGESSVSLHRSHSPTHVHRELLGPCGAPGFPTVVAMSILFMGHAQGPTLRIKWHLEQRCTGPDRLSLPSFSACLMQWKWYPLTTPHSRLSPARIPPLRRPQLRSSQLSAAVSPRGDFQEPNTLSLTPHTSELVGEVLN